MEIVDGGGHVGFVGRSMAPGHFWAADRILGFLKSVRVSSRSSGPRGGLLQ
jgi:predicted alpha/beta-fold hydrolase